MVAHVLESLGNVFNFSVPFLSWMAFVIFCIVTVILYFVPLRYDLDLFSHRFMRTILILVHFRAIIFLWGINKFTKKLLRPRSIDNNELADFISRVPDNEELVSHIRL